MYISENTVNRLGVTGNQKSSQLSVPCGILLYRSGPERARSAAEVDSDQGVWVSAELPEDKPTFRI